MAELIVYFSRAHENYVNGTIRNLKVGNTEVVAMMLKDLTGAEIFQLEPVKAYSEDYNTCIAQAQEEQRQNARPKLKAYPESLDGIDTIYLCYPNYWSTMPMPMFTFLERYDFTGKRICPLCTHEGSGMGSSEQDIRRLCPNAKLEKGLALRGGKVGTAKPELEAWLKRLGK